MHAGKLCKLSKRLGWDGSIQPRQTPKDEAFKDCKLKEEASSCVTPKQSISEADVPKQWSAPGLQSSHLLAELAWFRRLLHLASVAAAATAQSCRGLVPVGVLRQRKKVTLHVKPPVHIATCTSDITDTVGSSKPTNEHQLRIPTLRAASG